MELKQLLNNDKAVSPVIGVILMVAITVILAAVIGTFVLGLGDQVQQTAPNTQFSFDYNQGSHSGDDFGGTADAGDGLLTVTHDGGDSIQADQLDVSGSSVYTNNQNLVDQGPYTSGEEVSAGSSYDVAIANSDKVRIVWTAESGDQSSTVAQFDGPDA